MKRLREELIKCKQLGYAQDVGEITAGVNFISAPVFGVEGKIIGCIILIGIFAKSLIEKYGLRTTGVARQVLFRLGADVKTPYKM